MVEQCLSRVLSRDLQYTLNQGYYARRPSLRCALCCYYCDRTTYRMGKHQLDAAKDNLENLALFLVASAIMAASTRTSSMSIEPSSRPILAIILPLSQGHGSFAGLRNAKRSIGVIELESSGRYICEMSSMSSIDVTVDLELSDLVEDLERSFLKHFPVYEARSCLCAASIRIRPATYRLSGWNVSASIAF